eukprot:COSAG02_NODE_41384_length_395_cov_0.763514_1_plen_77_part_01
MQADAQSPPRGRHPRAHRLRLFAAPPASASSARMVWLNNLGFADPYGTTSGAVDGLFTRGARELGNGLRVVRVGDGD